MMHQYQKTWKITETSTQQQDGTFDGTFFCAIRPGNNILLISILYKLFLFKFIQQF